MALRFRPTKYSSQFSSRLPATELGSLYVLTFFTCYSIGIVTVIYEHFGFPGESSYGRLYPLLCMDAFLVPFQGVCNAFIYIRPRYNRIRVAYPEDSFLRRLHRTYFEESIHLLKLSRHRGVHKAIPIHVKPLENHASGAEISDPKRSSNPHVMRSVSSVEPNLS